MNKPISKDGVVSSIIIGLFLGIMVMAGLSILATPTNCYIEYGKIDREWGGNLYYHIEFTNREGTRRHIWLSDRPPDKLAYLQSLPYSAPSIMHDFNETLDEDVAFRWCYITLTASTRIRGAWTW